MRPHENHITDGEHLLAAEGELSQERVREIRRHLDGCPPCRMRRAQLEQTLADVVQSHREWNYALPPRQVSRARLQARLAQAGDPSPARSRPWHRLAWAAVVILVAAGVLWTGWPARRAPFAPNATWTPGSVRPTTLGEVCSSPESDEAAAAISAAAAHEVFRRYGIPHPRPGSYEVDYLIPPALGGAADARNLWPQPYSAGVWNARVKDALEDRLRTMVCTGKLDLATAQRELARDWIAAYKKYFRTRTPLVEHVAFVKDRPWE